MPASFTAPPKPLAFQNNARSPLGVTLIVVAFVHVLVIVLLLSHFGWLGSSNPEGGQDATAGQSGIVIPVTLESAETAVRSEAAPSPEPMAEPIAEPMAEPVPEPEIKQEQEIAPTVEPTTARDPDLSPTSEAPRAQTRAKTGASADSGKAAGPVKQSIEPSAMPLSPAQVDPNYLHRPNPVYPALSKRLREEGTVLLRVNLDAQGIVLDITVEKSSRFQRLDQAALEAVRQWRFIPAKRGQAAIPSNALVPIEFKQP